MIQTYSATGEKRESFPVIQIYTATREKEEEFRDVTDIHCDKSEG